VPISHRIAASFLDGEQHRVVCPEDVTQLETADDQEQQHWHNDASLDGRRAFLRASPKSPDCHYCSRTSVVAVKIAGMLGHGTNGVKA
jgi:hypothetical protein